MKNKKQRDPLEAAIESLVPDPESMNRADAEAELESVDLQSLHARIRETAQQLSRELRANGIAAPPVLRDVIDTFNTASDALPKDLGLAAARASQRLADIEQKKRIGRDYELLEAARKRRGELSEKDRALLDEEAADLKREIDAEDDSTE